MSQDLFTFDSKTEPGFYLGCGSHHIVPPLKRQSGMRAPHKRKRNRSMAKGSPLYGRYLLKDDPTSKRQTKAVLDGYFKSSSGLYLPHLCGGCGEELHKKKISLYMGEYFCTDCTEKWMRGGQ